MEGVEIWMRCLVDPSEWTTFCGSERMKNYGGSCYSDIYFMGFVPLGIRPGMAMTHPSP